jgi:hypothetical protein
MGWFVHYVPVAYVPFTAGQGVLISNTQHVYNKHMWYLLSHTGMTIPSLAIITPITLYHFGYNFLVLLGSSFLKQFIINDFFKTMQPYPETYKNANVFPAWLEQWAVLCMRKNSIVVKNPLMTKLIATNSTEAIVAPMVGSGGVWIWREYGVRRSLNC